MFSKCCKSPLHTIFLFLISKKVDSVDPRFTTCVQPRPHPIPSIAVRVQHLRWETSEVPLRADVRSRTEDDVQIVALGYLNEAMHIKSSSEVKHTWAGLVQIPVHVTIATEHVCQIITIQQTD